MNKYILLVFLLLFSSCSYLGGFEGLEEKQLENLNHSDIEKRLTKNTTFENMTVLTSLIEAYQNLENLEKELQVLELRIEGVNLDLENLEKQEQSPEVISYLNYLNSLTDQSKLFVSSLRDSTIKWDSYLSSAITNHNSLNFSQRVNESIFVDSIVDPFKVFIVNETSK